jgi:hypothetical protein
MFSNGRARLFHNELQSVKRQALSVQNKLWERDGQKLTFAA